MATDVFEGAKEDKKKRKGHNRRGFWFRRLWGKDETRSTFTWSFEAWLECMWDPQCIITDQNIAMRNAIAYVFPHTQHRQQEESYEDFKTLHAKPTMHVGNSLEKHARDIYTRKIFVLFQEELKQSLVYELKEVGDEGLKKMYEVKRDVVDERHQIVSFEDKLEIIVYCTCKKFEGECILCRHILRLFFQMDVDKYIRSIYCSDGRSMLEHGLQTSNMGVRAEISKSPSEHMPRVVLTDPLKVKTKGHPKTGNRLKSSLEISVSSK